MTNDCVHHIKMPLYTRHQAQALSLINDLMNPLSHLLSSQHPRISIMQQKATNNVLVLFQPALSSISVAHSHINGTDKATQHTTN